MNIRIDDNKYPIYETIKRTPLQATASVSIAASSTDNATVNVPDGEVWFIKSWAIVKGTNVTVDSIKIDTNDTYETAAVNNTESRYGAVLNAETSITINGTNAGAGAENLDITVDGYKIVF